MSRLNSFVVCASMMLSLIFLCPLYSVVDSPPPIPFIQKGVVLLDPGHGGKDVGTQSISKPRCQEKNLNLMTAKFVKMFLQRRGYRVLMTREDDTFISLDKRVQIANEVKPMIFVSIHYNAAPSSEAKGVEIFYHVSKDNKERTTASHKLAQSILKQVLFQTKALSRGVKNGNYLVIRDTKIPAVLVEGGFVTNEAELQLLKDPTYLKRLAWGISKGIDDYLVNVSSARLERAACCLGGNRSIHLSYENPFFRF